MYRYIFMSIFFVIVGCASTPEINNQPTATNIALPKDTVYKLNKVRVELLEERDGYATAAELEELYSEKLREELSSNGLASSNNAQDIYLLDVTVVHRRSFSKAPSFGGFLKNNAIFELSYEYRVNVLDGEQLLGSLNGSESGLQPAGILNFGQNLSSFSKMFTGGVNPELEPKFAKYVVSRIVDGINEAASKE